MKPDDRIRIEHMLEAARQAAAVTSKKVLEGLYHDAVVTGWAWYRPWEIAFWNLWMRFDLAQRQR